MTNVTALVKDPAGNIYANGHVSAFFTPNALATPGQLYVTGGTSPFQTFADCELDSFGNLTIALTDLATITPAGASWTFVVNNNANTIGFVLNTTLITGATVDISAALQAAAAPLNPATGFGNITVTGLTDTGPALLSGNVTAIAGQNQFKAFKFDNVLWVDGIKYTTIQAALNDLPATGGTVMVPPNYTETLAANLVISKSGTVLQFLGPCTITQGAFQVLVSAAANCCSILSPFLHGTDAAADSLGAVFTGYTGSTSAFAIGTSAAPTYNFTIQGIQLQMGSAAAGAAGFRFNQLIWLNVRYNAVVLGSVAGQIGFLFDGTGSFTGVGVVEGNTVQDGLTSTNSIAYREQNVCTAMTYIGGHCTLHNAGTSIGLHLASGAGAEEAYLFDFAVDNANTAIKVDSTFAGNVQGIARIDSTVTNAVNYGAGTTGNKVIANNTTATVIDSGTNNSYTFPTGHVENGRFWLVGESSTGYTITSQIVGSLGAVLNIVAGGNITLKSQAAGGAGLLLGNAGTLSPDSISTVSDLGTASIPWRNLFLGASNAATNNFQLQPAATTGARIITIADPLSPTTVGLPLTIAHGTSTLTANATLAATTSQAAITTAGTGILTTDTIEWSYASAPSAGDAFCIVSAYVTAGNVNFVRNNPTAAAQNVSALVINWRVVR